MIVADSDQVVLWLAQAHDVLSARGDRIAFLGKGPSFQAEAETMCWPLEIR